MSERALVFYDGDCRFCVASVDRIRALDWRRRLSYANARDPELLALYPQVDREKALARLQLVPAGGSPVHEGFYAFRWLAGRLPLLWILWPFLWLPGAAFLGTRLYDLVARNRFAFGTCETGACEIEPGDRAG